MDENIQKLLNEFITISKKGWVRSVDYGTGSVGLTFERELNKNPDSLFFPDYYGTEIKCTTRYSGYPISLFTIAFDGPSFPEIQRIVEEYGYFDCIYKDKKILSTELSCKVKNIVNKNYKFQLDVDVAEEKLYLCVYDLNDCLIERKSFVYFKSIRDHLELKLNRLAVVYASQKNFDDGKYFRYYKIIIYQFRGFSIFLEMLKQGEIDVALVSRIGRSGSELGKYKNKNLVFKIRKDKIDCLFERIYFLDRDLSNFSTFHDHLDFFK